MLLRLRLGDDMTTQACDRAASVLHRGCRLAGWLVLAAAAVAVWPITLVTAAELAVAWRLGWRAARLGRQAGWTLPMTAVWMAAESARGWRAMALDPVRDGASGWPHLTAAAVMKTFLLVAPVTIPAGLALAALLWAWRAAPRRSAPPRLTEPLVVVPAPRHAAAPVPSRLDGILGPGVPR